MLFPLWHLCALSAGQRPPNHRMVMVMYSADSVSQPHSGPLFVHSLWNQPIQQRDPINRTHRGRQSIVRRRISLAGK